MLLAILHKVWMIVIAWKYASIAAVIGLAFSNGVFAAELLLTGNESSD
ncbi:hypothetical protein [Vibrio sp. WXL103]